jgi:hypothetical protein
MARLKGSTKRTPSTHCLRGHEFTPDNVYLTGEGFRYCKTCQNERVRNFSKSPKGKLKNSTWQRENAGRVRDKNNAWRSRNPGKKQESDWVCSSRIPPPLGVGSVNVNVELINVEPKGHTQRHSLMSCANFLGACALGA